MLLAALVGGCGAGGGTHSPNVTKLPLAPGAQVVAQIRSCDRGANAYCALELVVVDRQYTTSADLVSGERAQLRHNGWTSSSGDTGDERAADSPGHQLRVTYATATRDLLGIELGWIKRSHKIAVALSHTLFERVPAMSVMLELGAG